jgi:hypothetical protein
MPRRTPAIVPRTAGTVGEPSAGGGRQKIVRRFVLLLVALSLAGCSHSPGRARGASSSTTTAPSTPAVKPPRVTSHLEIASRTIKAGAPVRVSVVIENRTGRPVPQPVCHASTEWQAYLTNGHDASGPLPTPTVVRCDPNKPAEPLPVGETRTSFTTRATYYSCANAADSYPPTPRCLEPSGEMPPLPAGTYRIEVNASPYVGVPKPAPLTTVILP